MFMNYIKNMGWMTSLVFTESGTEYKIPKNFDQIKLETVKTNYKALELAIIPNDNIKKLKYGGLYTWPFNTSNKLAQYLLAK